MGICGAKNEPKPNLYIANIRSSHNSPRIHLPTQNNEPLGYGWNNSVHIPVPTPKPQQETPIIDPSSTLQIKSKDTTGLTPAQISSTGAVYQFSSSTRRDGCECIICLVPYKEKENLKALQCLHTYHQKCIDEWLTKQSICPDCRLNVR